MMKPALQWIPGSVRASRAGFGALAKTIFAFFHPTEMKVRDGDGAIAPAGAGRGACAAQI
jgi:hypothetical protein